MTPEQRKLRAQIAAHTQWAKEADPSARTAKARAAAESKFEKQARELHPTAGPEEIARVAEHLKKAHMRRMGLASARARQAKAGKAA